MNPPVTPRGYAPPQAILKADLKADLKETERPLKSEEELVRVAYHQVCDNKGWCVVRIVTGDNANETARPLNLVPSRRSRSRSTSIAP